MVVVANFDTKQESIWDIEKFNDRLMSIRDMYSQYVDQNQAVPEMDNSESPFDDPPEPQLIGQGYYKLEPLVYLIDNPHQIQLIGNANGQKGGNFGKLEVNVIPTDEGGLDEVPEDLLPQVPEDLLER